MDINLKDVVKNLLLLVIFWLILIVSVVGCSGTQKASIETPQAITGSGNTTIAKSGQQQIAGQGAVTGEVDEVTNVISNGLPTWALITLILGLGIIIPQPKFIRVWF